MTVLKGKTFADLSRKPQSKVTTSCLLLKENRNLLGRMLIIAQARDLDLREVFTYPLGPVPEVFANFDESMTKTNKAVIAHHLETPIPEAVVDLRLEGKTVIIVDAMAMIQVQSKLPPTFGEFAYSILCQLVAIASKYGASRIDFITDRYKDVSIKTAERTRRAAIGTYAEIRITRPAMKMPRQFKKFLASGKNKESLIHFLFESWKEYKSQCLKDVVLYITHAEKCYKLESVNEKMVVSEVPNLQCDHEEADTRLFLHAHHAANVEEADNIIIRSPDTDVFMIAVSCAQLLHARLFLHLTSRNGRIIQVNKISERLGERTAQALLGLHVFSGCDTVSAFRGRGIKKMVNMLFTTDRYISTFQELGACWEVTDELMNEVEVFVSEVYGQKKCSSVNEARYNCFRLGLRSNGGLPLNRDSLLLHTKRANYQTAVYRRSLQQKINTPEPDGHGWLIANSTLTVQWGTLPAAPDFVLNYINCKCKKYGCTSKCSCKSANLVCTDLCQCLSCENKSGTENDESVETDSSSDCETDIE